MLHHKINRYLFNCTATLLTAMSGFMISGCDSIYDDSDCVESVNMVRLVYDHNMKFSDAFDYEVEQVSMLVFDKETGLLVQRKDVEKNSLNDNNEISLIVDPGSYELLVWAGRHEDSFSIAQGTLGKSTIEEFHCRMNREDGGHVNNDLARLYHGSLSFNAEYSSPTKPNKQTIHLKKNTNTIRVVLQHITGERVDCDDFDFTITDSNGWLNHDNTLRDDEQITYHPWYLYSGSVDINSNPTDSPESRNSGMESPATRASLGAALAEFTTGRLIWGNQPILTVTDKSNNRTVMRININDYAMLVKGFYHENMTEQEYLDRQDEYNMTFFLDEGNRWINTVIIINDWRIVRYEGPIS